jgi:hypothetical protein
MHCRSTIWFRKRKSTAGENNYQWKGGVFYYKNHTLLKKNRLLKIEQCGGSCEECNKPDTKLFAYHIDRSRQNHEIENLKMLCYECFSKKLNRTREGGSYLFDKEQVAAIKVLLKNFSANSIAKGLGCSPQTILKIKNMDDESCRAATG